MKYFEIEIDWWLAAITFALISHSNIIAAMAVGFVVCFLAACQVIKKKKIPTVYKDLLLNGIETKEQFRAYVQGTPLDPSSKPVFQSGSFVSKIRNKMQEDKEMTGRTLILISLVCSILGFWPLTAISLLALALINIEKKISVFGYAVMAVIVFSIFKIDYTALALLPAGTLIKGE